MSLASVCHGGIVCVGVIFSRFLGVSFIISCIMDSLNLFSMPSFLLTGFIGRGRGVASCLLVSCCSWAGKCSCMGFLELVLATTVLDHSPSHNLVLARIGWGGGCLCIKCILILNSTCLKSFELHVQP